MFTTHEIHSDQKTQAAVQAELQWSPDFDASGIGVAVKDGAVILSGEVKNLSEQHAATRAALRVDGVSTVVDDLTVHPEATWAVTELDIAKEVEHALTWAANVPETVQAKVEGHKVTLTGEVTWDFQRQAARRAILYLRGVHMVDNHISLSARPSVAGTEDNIRKALVRNAQIDAGNIDVLVHGTRVTLSGDVRSWSEKQQAGRAAWASPDVTDVDNRLYVQTS